LSGVRLPHDAPEQRGADGTRNARLTAV